MEQVLQHTVKTRGRRTGSKGGRQEDIGIAYK